MKQDPPVKSFAAAVVVQKLAAALPWIGPWLLYVLLITLVGAIVFGIAYPIVGSIIGMDLTFREMFVHGLRNGAFLIGGVWGPGLAFIICVIRAHQRRERNRNSGQ